LDAFDHEGLRLLFLHELSHAKRRDILANWIATIVHVVHWWNPLVALALARMRADRELATDAMVLAHEPPSAGRRYGQTLIDLLEFAHPSGLLPASVGVLEDRSELRRRVTMIARNSQEPRRGAVLFAGLALLLGLTTLTAAMPARPETLAPAAVDATAATAPAQRALEAWLATVDAQDFAKGWDDASPTFQAAIGKADWVKVATAANASLGALRTRTLRSATLEKSLPSAPDGRYAVVVYQTTFENIGATVETCTLKLDDDGQWRVVGRRVGPDVDTTAAQDALRAWLGLLDAQAYGPSWDEAAPLFKTAVSRDDWAKAARGARQPFGALVSRQVRVAAAQAAVPGMPNGQYVVVQTDAAFAHKASAHETATLQLAPDARWRVVGYLIR
jgi:uncharacterized protein DUF4019/BlaR1 peptidase M56